MKTFLLTWASGTVGVLSFYAFTLSGLTNNTLLIPALIGGIGFAVGFISFFTTSSDNN